MALPGSSGKAEPSRAPPAVAQAADLAERSGFVEVYPSRGKGVKGRTRRAQLQRNLPEGCFEDTLFHRTFKDIDPAPSRANSDCAGTNRDGRFALQRLSACLPTGSVS